MTKQNKKIIVSILFILVCSIATSQIYTSFFFIQPGGPCPGGPPCGPPPPNPGLPLDGPLMFVLAIAGVYLGMKKKIKRLKD